MSVELIVKSAKRIKRLNGKQITPGRIDSVKAAAMKRADRFGKRGTTAWKNNFSYYLLKLAIG